MLTSPLTYMIETHMIYKKIALFHVHYFHYTMYYCMLQDCLRDITFKTKFQNFHIKFLNSDFSVSNALNVTKFLGDAFCSPLKGSVSQNLI